MPTSLTNLLNTTKSGRRSLPDLFTGADPDVRYQSIVTVKEVDGLPVLDNIIIAENPATAKSKGRSLSANTAALSDMAGILRANVAPRFAGTTHSHSYVEFPTIRDDTPHKQSIVSLSAVSGMLLASLPRAVAVTPQMWKGSIDKATHQCRIYREMGWQYIKRKSYATPTGPAFDRAMQKCLSVVYDNNGVNPTRKISSSKWADIGDSLGLALYGWQLSRKTAKRKSVRDEMMGRT